MITITAEDAQNDGEQNGCGGTLPQREGRHAPAFDSNDRGDD
jgi:hypothetical protein